MKKEEVKSQLEFYPVEQNSQLRVNIVEAAKVHAGFPSPVQDAYMNPPIDLNHPMLFPPRPCVQTFLLCAGAAV